MSPRILFAPDSGALVGGGHVMRCLTLAGALAERGGRCSLLAQAAGRRLAAAFGPAGLDLIDPGEDGLEDIAIALGELGRRFDVAVVDNYRLGAAEEALLAASVGGARIVVIDDLADRRHACDLLIDSGFERRPGDYAGLVGAEAVVLTGVDYAPLRPAFPAARPAARARRDGRPVARVLVSLGLTDIGGVTGRVVETVLPLLGEVELDIVVGAQATSLDRLAALARADRRIRLHVDAADMAELMAEADIAIGAGGSSTWERACLGLPSLSLILADNQRAQNLNLAAKGLVLVAEADGEGFEATLGAGWYQLVGDATLRRDMSRRNMELCDGQGAARVAEAIMERASGAGIL